MKYCFNCGNEVNGDDICANCGTNIGSSTDINISRDSKNNIVLKRVVVTLTVIYIIIYCINLFYWQNIMGITDRLIAGTTISIFMEVVQLVNISFFFTLIPYILSLVFSLIYRKRGIITFNIVFLMLHLIFFLLWC